MFHLLDFLLSFQFDQFSMNILKKNLTQNYFYYKTEEQEKNSKLIHRMYLHFINFIVMHRKHIRSFLHTMHENEFRTS